MLHVHVLLWASFITLLFLKLSLALLKQTPLLIYTPPFFPCHLSCQPIRNLLIATLLCATVKHESKVIATARLTLRRSGVISAKGVPRSNINVAAAREIWQRGLALLSCVVSFWGPPLSGHWHKASDLDSGRTLANGDLFSGGRRICDIYQWTCSARFR